MTCSNPQCREVATTIFRGYSLCDDCWRSALQIPFFVTQKRDLIDLLIAIEDRPDDEDTGTALENVLREPEPQFVGFSFPTLATVADIVREVRAKEPA